MAPAAMIGEIILEPVLEILFHVVCYYVGRVTVCVTTFGHVACEDPIFGKTGGKVKCGGLYRRRGPSVYLDADATAMVGLVVAILFSVWIYRSRT